MYNYNTTKYTTKVLLALCYNDKLYVLQYTNANRVQAMCSISFTGRITRIGK